MNIQGFLVLAAICAMVTANVEEEYANTDVLLSEYDLDDLCYSKAESEWAFLTGSDLPGGVFQKKVQDEQKYAEKFRSFAEEATPYLEQQLNYADLKNKLQILFIAGDFLVNKKESDKQVQFSNSLQQITRQSNPCANESCQLDLQEVQHVLATSRDPEKLRDAWTGYHRRFSSKIDEYLEILQLVKAAAEVNGAGDVETYWEQQTELPGGYTKALFLWQNIKPLYQKLHTFVFKQLSKNYAFLRSTKSTLIPAHLLGTIAGNDWTYIADHVLYSRSYNHMLTSIKRKMLGGRKVYKRAENMTAMLGLESLPPKFWEQSWFNSSCPAHVVNYCKDGEARVLTCNLTGWPEYLDAYETTMRIKHIHLAENNPFLFRDNDHSSAIYEAVTGLSALLATAPWYLQQLGILSPKNNQKGSVENAKASLLLLMALRTLPKLPYYLAADLWRIEALNGNVTNSTELNNAWRKFRTDMEMISIPTENENIFDFLSDPYIMSNKPYLGKFYGIVLQFQLLEMVLEGADIDSNDVDMADVLSSNEYLKNLLHRGKSNKWPYILEEVTVIDDLDSGPLLSYFQNLDSYLEKLEKLEPIKPSRHIVISTSTPPTSSIRIHTISLNETTLLINSTIPSVEQNSENSDSKMQYSTGTVILFSCVALTAVVLVVGFFIICRRRLSRPQQYDQTTTQEI